MVYAICAILGLQLIASIALPLLAYRILTRRLRQFVTSPDPETPSALAVMADNVATIMAGRLWQYIEVRLRGSAGGASKQAGVAEVSEAVQGNPLAAIAMGMLPKSIRNALIRNPGALTALGNLGGGRGGNHQAQDHSGNQSHFSL